MKYVQPANRGIPLTEWANEVEQIFDRFLGKPLANSPALAKRVLSLRSISPRPKRNTPSMSIFQGSKAKM